MEIEMSFEEKKIVKYGTKFSIDATDMSINEDGIPTANVTLKKERVPVLYIIPKHQEEVHFIRMQLKAIAEMTCEGKKAHRKYELELMDRLAEITDTMFNKRKDLQ